jgi:mono/diheme cytochrome c family protein
VPATQLGRGWVNTNALSIIDLREREHHTTVLLDHPYEGAADPWGLALAASGEDLWISLRGVHQLARLKVAKLHSLLAGEPKSSPASTSGYGASTYDVWQKIKRDPSQRKALVNDLGALHVAELIKRFPIPGKGPRGLDISPDGKRLAVAMYYSGTVVIADAESGKVTSTISLGAGREPDLARRGEQIFHDADVCFQRWMSCSTCHPDNGRTDGLRWDLMNDGLGTPQRTRSLLMSHKINPTTARGVRGGLEDSVPKGLLFFRRVPEPELTEAIIAYLTSLEPEPSPYLVDGELSTTAKQGKDLFHGKAKCVRCHKGTIRTDLKAHDVGTRGEFDRPDDVFYTPKLIELFRTAPFLHDGRAATLREVLTKYNPQGLHGMVSELSPPELDSLIEYLNSL